MTSGAWRWFIAAGYILPALLLAIATSRMPSDSGKLGGAAFIVVSVEAASFIGVAFLFAGAGFGVAALRRARHQFHWYDYAVLMAGALPLLAILVIAVIAV